MEWSRLRQLESDSYDVIIVGAGIGGLTAAAFLVARGMRVLVLDQHYVAGGNATMFKRRGYRFDVGVHYLGMCGGGLLSRLLRVAGVDDLAFEELDPDGYDTLVYPGFTFRMPRGVDALERRLCEYFPAERRGIGRYMTLMRRILALVGRLGHRLGLGWAMLRGAALARLPRYSDFLDGCTRDPRLRAVLAGQHGTYALPPSRASTLIGVGMVAHYTAEGAYYPRGGGQVIADRLAAVVERRGGRLLLRARVHRILVRKRRVEGVEIENPHLGRRILRAPIVLSNADFKRTMLELVGGEHLKPRRAAAIADYEMSPALAALFLGVRRDLAAEGHRRTNYWIHPALDSEAQYRAAARGEHVEEPSLYASIASLKDPSNTRLAPPGVTNLQLVTVAPSQPAAWGVTEEQAQSGEYRRQPAYQAHKARQAAALLSVAERVFPGLREQVLFHEVATPLSHRRFTGATDGTSYGLALVPSQVLFGRPAATTEIGGLYLCGANCCTFHGVIGAAVSGVMAAQEIAGGALWRQVFGAAPAAAVDEVVASLAKEIA